MEIAVVCSEDHTKPLTMQSAEFMNVTSGLQTANSHAAIIVAYERLLRPFYKILPVV
jgi:hypothetical protein